MSKNKELILYWETTMHLNHCGIKNQLSEQKGNYDSLNFAVKMLFNRFCVCWIYEYCSYLLK